MQVRYSRADRRPYLLSIALLAFLAILGATQAPARADILIYVAYAENERTPQFFPNPWKGSPNTIFFGYDGPAYDTGAILIQNRGPSDVTLGPGAYVDGFTNGARFQLWDSYIGTGAVIHPGQNLILTETANSNFDTSDQPIQFVPDNSKPVVHLTIDGVARTFVDTAQVINTGGYDPGNTLGRNESVQWRVIGTTGILYPGGTGVMNVTVPTHHNDNARTGQNTREMTLTPANVTPDLFGKLFSYPVDGQIYAQPLHYPRLSIPGKGIHNVVYVATEHDTAYAFDADTNAGANATPLWKVSLVPPNGIPCPTDDICSGNISPEFGVTGTPVIDTTTSTLFVVGKTKETVNGATQYVQRLHALNIATGAEKFGGPVVISASMPGKGEGSDGNGNVLFLPLRQFQRPALLLHNGLVYVAFASHCDFPPYHGWVMAYNAQTLQPQGVFNTTPDAVTQNNIPAGAAIWQAGNGPAADASYVYLETGNGLFDVDQGGRNYGDSLLKLRNVRGSLLVSDYFTPTNQNFLNQQDIDLGSCGPMIPPDQTGAHPHIIIGVGKDGTIFVVDRDNMGKFNASHDSVIQVLRNAIGWSWSSPAYFNNTVYFQSVNDVMKAFSLSGGALSSAPVAAAAVGYGYPGATPSVSADGTKNGIVWALENGNGEAVLHAYTADTLTELYNSHMAPGRDSAGGYLNFTVPTIANSKVYVGSRDRLTVYGAGFFAPAPVISPNGGPFSQQVTVSITDAVTDATIHYTTDGTAPDENSPVYTSPFVLTANAVVQAKAYRHDFQPSATARASFLKQNGPLLYAINSGGGAAGSFLADTLFNGGNTFSIGDAIDTSQVTNPAPQGVYQSERYGNFTYNLNGMNPGKLYKIRLHFAEIYWNNAGARRFNVLLNGQQVINDLDIFAVAGGKNKALVREFLTKADQNGNIAVQYVTIADNAKSSGIEVMSPIADVTSQVTVLFKTHTFANNVHTYVFLVKNNGPALDGPLYLVMGNVPAGTTAVNAVGNTTQTDPLNSPYFLITSGGLASGATSATFNVQFNKSLPSTVTKTVLAGPGNP